jgi:type I restriction enzyme S subunit
MNKKVKLNSICEILDNKRKPLSDNERQERIKNKNIDDLYPYYGATKQVGYIDDYIFNDELILLGEDGVMFYDPTKPKAYLIKGKSWVNNHAHVLKIDNAKANTNYILYYLNIFNYQGYVSGSTRLKLNKSKMCEIPIPLPSLEKQNQIAKTLDKVNELIGLRKESITKLDALAKSIFIDMFGDPVSNPKGWETEGIESLVSKEKYSIKRGPFGGSLKKEIFVKEGYLVYEQYHALNNDFTFARYFIDEKKYQELKAFEVQAGDIIISCSGVYLGKLAVIPNDFKKGIINQALLKISLDENIMKNVMFINIFTNPNFKKKFFGNNIGSGVPNFPSMPDFKRFEFIFPPINLQNKFAKIIEKIEEQKSLYEKELELLQNNFDALLQKSFQE